MKYIFLLLLLASGYWAYSNNLLLPTNNEQLSPRAIIERDGFITAGEVLKHSKYMASFICKDNEVLRSWGSTSQACFEKVQRDEKRCANRVFRDPAKKIFSSSEVKALMSKYNKCVLPK